MTGNIFFTVTCDGAPMWGKTFDVAADAAATARRFNDTRDGHFYDYIATAK